MSEHTATLPAEGAPAASFMSRHYFLLRRLHSLSGIVPVGLFVIAHLFTNFQMIRGGEAFQHEVDFIHGIPALLFVEIGLWLGIGFHAVLGVYYMVGAKHNVKHYPYMDNWRYTLQRVTAWVALIFIFLHIATLRWRWDLFGWFTPFYHRMSAAGAPGHSHGDVPMSMPLTAYALQYSWVVVLFYVIGVLSVVFHWCNGLWTAAITWGATISEAAMRRWGYICAGLGIALTLFMGGAIVGALRYDLLNDTTPKQREVLEKVVPGWSAPGAGAAESS